MKVFACLVALAAAAAVAAPSPEVKPRDPIDDSAPHQDDPEFISAVMRAHWYWRRLHCAQDLVWDPELANKAQAAANMCKKQQKHEDAGTNLSAVSQVPGNYSEWIEFARTATHGWHEEETRYPYDAVDPKFDGAWGHFSQMVWRNTSRIGCALAHCNDQEPDEVEYPGRFYCQYMFYGNIVAPGEFHNQVWGPVCGDPAIHEVEARSDVNFDWTVLS